MVDFSTDFPEPCETSKNKRILIGKNVEKLPEFSTSTLERSLNVIINDPENRMLVNSPIKASNNNSSFNTVSESLFDICNENFNGNDSSKIKIINRPQTQNNLNFGKDFVCIPMNQNVNQLNGFPIHAANYITQFGQPVQQNPMFIDLNNLAGAKQIIQPQIMRPVIIPSSFNQNLIQKTPQPAQPAQTDNFKKLMPMPTTPGVHSHLKKALLETNESKKKGRKSSVEITSSDIATFNSIKKSAEEEKEKKPKKPREYRRITPTIRAMMLKNIENGTSTPQSTPAPDHSPQQTAEIEEIAQNQDVHDEISNIFVMGETNKASNDSKCDQGNSSDISLDDMIVNGTDKKKKKNKKAHNKSKNDDSSDDDFLLITATTNTSRNLRSRTSSQRKML